MRGGAAARRYAKALMDLARRDGLIAEIGSQLQQYLDLLHDNAALRQVLENPSIDVQVKTGIVMTILERTQPAPLLRNFLLLLVNKGRLPQLDAICLHYARMADDELGRVVARVTTASELDAQQRQMVIQKIAAATNKDVLLETQVDPAILGGLVVRVNNMILDGSIRNQLARMRKALIGG
ncbi:MAG: ATP synthase F1 subunit delta [Candidatus Tectomicrobia bacterium]|uniref:ATP synthase subunit delta n=1 Tax=Tectimicrobiota bacterium TaxID=2528274 RepID=A0A938B2R5_UNCTE|nr:ATP synthase F1 subunit delta [Candidatus Tectomicrobia bacterium]